VAVSPLAPAAPLIAPDSVALLPFVSMVPPPEAFSVIINFSAANNFGTGIITLNGGGLQWATGTTTDISGRLAPIGANGAAFDTNGNNVTLASSLIGAGSLTKVGAGTLTLNGVNSYAGGTFINGGTLAVNNDGLAEPWQAQADLRRPGGTCGGFASPWR
jgi:autotransporter-associated beta strand protein